MKGTDLLHLSDVGWAYREVERQHDLSAQHVMGMCEALMHARMHAYQHVTPQLLREWNWCIKGIGKFRNVNLQSPPSASPWETVEHEISKLCDVGSHLSPMEFTWCFLDIHPFVDGNGRVAAILLNYLSKTLAPDSLHELPEWEKFEEAGRKIRGY